MAMLASTTFNACEGLRVSADHGPSLLAHRVPHRELSSDEVPDRIRHVGPPVIGLVELRQRITMWICFPPHLLEVLDDVLATRIYKQPMLTSMVLKFRVYAVHAILHRWIYTRDPKGHVVPIGITLKELPHDLPVGSRRRRSSLLGRGIAEHLNI